MNHDTVGYSFLFSDSMKQFDVRPKRMAYKPHQVEALMNEFCKNKYVSREKMEELGKVLDLTPKQIKVWFQNRRMKERTSRWTPT